MMPDDETMIQFSTKSKLTIFCSTSKVPLKSAIDIHPTINVSAPFVLGSVVIVPIVPFPTVHIGGHRNFGLFRCTGVYNH